MEKYLYHKVPLEGIVGSCLYPLSELQKLCPEIYKKRVDEYVRDGRENILEMEIPCLNCFWKDVIYLTAISPIELRNGLKKAGIAGPKLRFFEIKASQLDYSRTVVMFFSPNERWESVLDKYEEFNDHFEKYSTISEQTIEWWRKSKSSHLLFRFIPHIMHKGMIDVRDAKIIEV